MSAAERITIWVTIVGVIVALIGVILDHAGLLGSEESKVGVSAPESSTAPSPRPPVSPGSTTPPYVPSPTVFTSASASPRLDSPVWVTDADWQQYTSERKSITPGIGIVGGKKYSHSLNIHSYCPDIAVVIPAPSSAHELSALLAISDRTEEEVPLDLRVEMYTTSDILNEETESDGNWTLAGEFQVRQAKPVRLKEPVADATAVKFVTIAKQCTFTAVVAEGQFN